MIEPKDLIAAKAHNELFSTKEQRERASQDLQALLAHPGWILLEKILKIHIEALGEAILNDEEMDAAKEKELKQERIYCKLFKETPVSVAQDLMRKDVEDLTEDDPYS